MAKKSFKDNPALQFFSTPHPEDEAPSVEKQSEKAPSGFKVNPLYVEVKSRRLQLVLQPSLYNRVKAKAEAEGLSVNEFVHQILDNATRED